MAKRNHTWRNRIVGAAEVPPDQLLANPANFRRHPKEQQAALEGVISELGYLDPVLVQAGTDLVIDGHLRIELALRSGQTTIPVQYVDLTDDETRLALATFDPIAGMAFHDQVALDALLASVQTDDDGVRALLESLGGEVETIAEGLTDPDAVPEPPAEAITKPGDLWLLGRHRLLCGDSTVITDVERLMGGEGADMVFTDPPYGISYRDTGAGAWDEEKLAKKRAGLLRPRFEAIAGDDLNGEQLVRFLVDALGNAAIVSDPKAAWYVWHACSTASLFEQAISEVGYEIRAVCVWAKSRPAFNFAQYKYQHEPVFYAFRSGNAPNWYGDKSQTTLWEVPSESGANYDHPTQKPVGLADIALQNSTEPNDLVLDLFGGSGSTLIACEQTGRRAALMELDPVYCDVIVRRWEQFTGQQATLAPRVDAMAAD